MIMVYSFKYRLLSFSFFRIFIIRPHPPGSFSIYEQPKWERIVASTQVGFRVSIWVRIRIRVWIRVRIRVRLGLYFGCSYIEKGPSPYMAMCQ